MTHPQLAQALSAQQGILTFSKPVKWTQWSPQHTLRFGAATLPQRIVLTWTPSAMTTESFTDRQSFTKTWQGAEAKGQLESIFQTLWALQYQQLQVQTPTFDLHVLRKGERVTIKERPASKHFWTDDSGYYTHTLDVETDAAMLRHIDLLTPEGTIRASMSDKFRQLNHLLNIVDTLDVVRELRSGSVLHVIDAGCGKAYLSVALSYVMNKRGIDVHLLGVDTNQHVIEHNIGVAEALGLANARFEKKAIAEIGTNEKCDLLIALHACDTATDEALAVGIRTNTLAMLVAPCCHHDVQKQLRAVAANVPAEVRPLLEDGIVRERLGDLLTDTMRRDIIRSYGYDAHLEEFIALEHTMKNILLKATRKSKKATIPDGLPPSVQLLMQTWGVKPYLPSLLTA
ncbi:MAG: SAM-dependent methyltransferase [bacterium]|nr:SAM-dependent methyltransferase [bacterium]